MEGDANRSSHAKGSSSYKSHRSALIFASVTAKIDVQEEMLT